MRLRLPSALHPRWRERAHALYIWVLALASGRSLLTCFSYLPPLSRFFTLSKITRFAIICSWSWKIILESYSEFSNLCCTSSIFPPTICLRIPKTSSAAIFPDKSLSKTSKISLAFETFELSSSSLMSDRVGWKWASTWQNWAENKNHHSNFNWDQLLTLVSC